MSRIVNHTIWPIVKCLIKLFSLIFPLKKGLVVCWSFDGTQIGGNPKHIVDYLRNSDDDYYRIVWFVKRGRKIKLTIDYDYCLFKSIGQFFFINTAEFIISDTRVDPMSVLWLKRKGQKYIMTWHGGMGIKKIEGDVIETLPESYIDIAKNDSKNADLFLSGSDFLTKQYRRAFWYNGEILQKGMPEYDVFFDDNKTSSYREKIRRRFNVDDRTNVVLYAPTFRKDNNLNCYLKDWQNIIDCINNKYNRNTVILVKLHPSMQNLDIKELVSGRGVIDVTNEGDIIPLICASDILITDYSSTMFEMAFLRRPVFIYAIDYINYDRGSYFNLYDLPFPFAYNIETLIHNILEYDYDHYLYLLNNFMYKELGACNDGHACYYVKSWMDSKRIRTDC